MTSFLRSAACVVLPIVQQNSTGPFLVCNNNTMAVYHVQRSEVVRKIHMKTSTRPTYCQHYKGGVSRVHKSYPRPSSHCEKTGISVILIIIHRGTAVMRYCLGRRNELWSSVNIMLPEKDCHYRQQLLVGSPQCQSPLHYFRCHFFVFSRLFQSSLVCFLVCSCFPLFAFRLRRIF